VRLFYVLIYPYLEDLLIAQVLFHVHQARYEYYHLLKIIEIRILMSLHHQGNKATIIRIVLNSFFVKQGKIFSVNCFNQLMDSFRG